MISVSLNIEIYLGLLGEDTLGKIEEKKIDEEEYEKMQDELEKKQVSLFLLICPIILQRFFHLSILGNDASGGARDPG